MKFIVLFYFLIISSFYLYIKIIIKKIKVLTINIHFSDLTSAQTNRRPSSASRSLGINSKSSSSGNDFDCPEEFGYYPHPNDCTQYYVCVFGGALLESCTGGLMYSHELQTCDWPRNVGCEVTENDAQIASGREQVHHQQPHKFRFSSLQAGPSSQKPQSQAQHAIQAQIQSIPPPPELRIAPNPVITSRGQPKLIEQQNIAKVRENPFCPKCPK